MKILDLKIMLAVACSLVTISVFSQGTQWRLLGNNNVTAGTNFLGTTNAQPIDFKTNNTQRMRIDGTTGFVGMGPNSLNAAFQLSVDNDININTTYAANTNNQLGFRINSEKILNNFGVNNIFVGVNAGLNNTLAGDQNTFVGSNAGSANIDGNRNTFLGSNAGQSVVSSDFNTL